MRYLVSIATGADIVCVQEARGSQQDQHQIQDFLPGWTVLGTHMHDGASGGLLFLLSPAMAHHYPAPHVDVVRGRIAILRLRARDCTPIDIANLHLIDSINLPLHIQLAKLRRSFSPLAHAHTILVGDMNLVAAGEGRLQATTGELRPERRDRVGYMEERFPEVAEVVADGYNRRQLRNGMLDVSSRIDHVMINSHTVDIESVKASARYVSPVVAAALPSDHTALALSFTLFRSGSRRVIPRWIIDHPMFAALCDEVVPEIDILQDRPFENITRTVDVFHKIADKVRRAGRPTSGRSAHAWIAHWLTVARTAHGRGDARRLHEALARIGGDEHTAIFVDDSGDVRARIDEGRFAEELGRLQVAHAMGDLREELAAAKSDEEKSAIRVRAHRRLAPHSPHVCPSGGRLRIGIWRRGCRRACGALGSGLFRVQGHFRECCRPVLAPHSAVRCRSTQAGVRRVPRGRHACESQQPGAGWRPVPGLASGARRAPAHAL